ncbi:sulfotransferase [Actinomadura yumaensis]
MDRVFDGRIDDRAHVLKVFERHITEVTSAIPPERLLVLDVREGWEPLCAFLGEPVPDVPFPEANERATFRRKRPRRLLRLIIKGR